MSESGVQIGPGTTRGEYCVFEPGVVIGRNCVIGHHVVLHAGTVVGDRVRIDDFASVGKLPMKAAGSAPRGNAALGGDTRGGALLGDGCMLGTGAVVYAGAEVGLGCLIADFATVRERVRIGGGTIVGRGAAVENDCTVGARCKIETNAYLAAFSRVEDDCFVAPCVVTSNDNFAGRAAGRRRFFKGVTVRRGGRLGAGAVVLPGREIGPDGFAAAGSVVTRNVPPGKIVAGVPARPLRGVPDNQLLKNQKAEK